MFPTASRAALRYGALGGGVFLLGAMSGFALRSGTAPLSFGGKPGLHSGTPRDPLASLPVPLAPRSGAISNSGSNNVTNREGHSLGADQFQAALQLAMKEPNQMKRGIRIYELAQELDLDGIQAAAARARGLPNSDRWSVEQALGSRWAEMDPQGAAAFALKAGNRSGLLPGVLASWVVASPDAAVAWVKSLPAGPRQGQLLWSMLDAVGRNDPQRALTMLQTAMPPGNQSQHYSNLFSGWAQRDPQGAADAIRELPVGKERTSAIRSVAAQWADTDPQAALAWAGQISQKSVQTDTFSAIGSRWAQNDPLGAFSWASHVSDRGTRKNVLSAVLTQWVDSDAPAATAQALALPAGSERTSVLRAMARRLAQQDVQSAIGLIQQMPSGEQPQAMREAALNLANSDPKSAAPLLMAASPGAGEIQNLVQQWGNSDVPAALAWSMSLPAGDGRNQALSSLAQTWAQDDPRAAANWFERQGLLRENKGIANSIASRWVQDDPDGALRWVASLPAGDLQNSALSGALQNLSRGDPEKAAQLLASSNVPQKLQPDLAPDIASNWTRIDPAQAARWAGGLANDQARANALGAVATTWSQQDPGAVASWLQQLPAGKARDSAVSGFARNALQTDPQGALAWVGTLQDDNNRNSQMEDLARRWMRMDSDAAKQWIAASTGLSAEAKQRLLKL